MGLILGIERPTFAQTTFAPLDPYAGGYAWTNAANWDFGVPNGVAATAILSGGISANATVTLGQTITLGTLHISGTNSYTVVADSGSSLFFNQGVNGTAIVSLGAGSTNHAVLAAIGVNPANDFQITQNSSVGGLTIGPLTIGGSSRLFLNGIGNVTVQGITMNGGLTISNTSSNTPGALYISGAIVAGGSTLTLDGSGPGATSRTIFAAPSTFGAIVIRQANTLQIDTNGVTWTGLTLSNSGARLELNTGVTVGSGSPLITSAFGSSKALAMVASATSATYAGSLSHGDDDVFFIQADAGQTLTFSGSLGGTGGPIEKIGQGMLVLTNPGNSFVSDELRVTNGILRLTNSGSFVGGKIRVGGTATTSGTLQIATSLATWSALTLSATGATVQLGQGVTVSSSNPLVVEATGNDKTLSLMVGATTATYAGTLTLRNLQPFHFAVDDGQSLTVSGSIVQGVVSATGGWAKEGPGAISLTGNITLVGAFTIAQNSTVGGMTLSGSTLSITSTLTLMGPGTTTINSQIRGNGGIAKVGSGTLALRSANSYSGTTTIGTSTVSGYGGTIVAGANSVLANGNSLYVASGTFDLNGYTLSLQSLTFGGSSAATNSAQRAAFDIHSGTLTVANLAYAAAGSPTANAQLRGGTVALSSNPTITVANSVGTDVDLEISASLSFSGGLNLAGAGRLLLSGSNTYSGNTTLAASGTTLRIANSQALGTGGIIAMVGSLTTFELLDGVTLSNSFSFANATANSSKMLSVPTINSIATILGNFQAPGSSVSTFTLSVATGSSLTLAGLVSTGAQTFSKIGAGTVFLTNTNSAFDMQLAVREGTVAFTSISDGGGGAPSALGDPTTNGRFTITLGATGSTLTSAGLRYIGTGADSTTRGLSLLGNAFLDASGGGTLTFSFDNSSSNTNFISNGSIAKTLTLTGSGVGALDGASIPQNVNSSTSLVKSGSGTWILNANQTFSGNTSLLGGKLVVNADFTSPTVEVSGGTLAGGGTILGTVTVTSGELAPGNSPGTLTIADLNMTGGNYVWELATLTTSGAGINFDLLVVDGGTAELSSSASVLLDFSLLPISEQPGANSTFWLADHQWLILTATGGGSVNGTFAALSEFVDLGIYGSGMFSLEYEPTNVYLAYNFSAVPEPCSLLLATIGAMGIVGLRRRCEHKSRIKD